MVRCRPGIAAVRGGPGSAMHRFAALALHRIRDTQNPRTRSSSYSPFQTAFLVLAQLAFRNGDLAAARTYNAQAIEQNQKAKEIDDVFASRILEARIASAGGRFDDARATLQAVARAILPAKPRSICALTIAIADPKGRGFEQV